MKKIRTLSEAAFLKVLFAFFSAAFLIASLFMPDRGQMITGLWQISGRSDITDFEEVVRLDREYIQNWSPELDFQILIKTVSVVLKHEGAE